MVWRCSSVGRASDRQTAPLMRVRFPRAARDFFFQSQLSVQTLLRCPNPPPLPCAIACINVCVHVKDPVVHVRVLWIMETLKQPARTLGWVARLCHSWLSPGKQPEFPWEKSRWENTTVVNSVHVITTEGLIHRSSHNTSYRRRVR